MCGVDVGTRMTDEYIHIYLGSRRGDEEVHKKSGMKRPDDDDDRRKEEGFLDKLWTGL